MADELLTALGKRQRELDESASPPIEDAVEGDAGEALLDGLFEQLDSQAREPEATATVTALPARRPWGVAAVAFAAAAALVLWFAARPGPEALPEYTAVTVSGGAATVRGAQDEPAKRVELSGPSDRIRWEFSAASPVERPLAVSLLARPASGDAVLSRASAAEISASGSVRLEGPLDRFIALSPGSWTVEVIVSPADAAPASAQDAAASDWQRLPIEVIIAAP